MAAKLDRKRDFGEIMGDHPCRYTQDNKWFNAQGIECDENGKLKKGLPEGKSPLDPAIVAKATASAQRKPGQKKSSVTKPETLEDETPEDEQLAAQLAGEEGDEKPVEDPLL